MDDSELVLREIENLSETSFLPIIGRRKGSILTRLIHDKKPTKILEVGTLIGYSAILMARELNEDSQIITIEIDADEANMARENIKRAKVPAKVEVITGDALEVIPNLEGIFDLVFIDAAKEQYIDYLRLAEPKIKSGTVIVADNAGMFANLMADYLKYVRESGKYTSRFIPVGGDGLEISIKI